jgi:glycine cleavage system H protein
MAYPAGYKYTKTHEWLDTDGKTGSVGITDYAQSSLGDIVFVELPKVNEGLNAAPETINTDANATWMFKLELSDAGELTALESLIDGAAYETFVSEETGH